MIKLPVSFLKQNRQRIFLTTAFLAFLLLCLTSIFLFGANGDEGQYLSQARLFGDYGLLPGLDYFASNPPLFYMLYGWFMQLFGYTFESARVLSLLFFLGTITLLYQIALKLSDDWKTALLVTALFALNWGFFRNNVIMKHYAPSNFFLLGGVYFLLNDHLRTLPERLWNLRYFLSGLFLGLALGVRFHLMAGLLPFFLFWIIGIHLAEGRRTLLAKHILLGLAGFACASIPLLHVFIQNPDGFLFNVYRYPFHLAPNGVHGHPQPYLSAWRAMLWLGPAKQNLLIMATAIASVILYYFLGRRSENKKSYSLILLCATSVIFVYSFSPVGTYEVHLYQSLPYWFLLTIPLVRRMLTVDKPILIAAFLVGCLTYGGLFAWKPLPRLLTVNNRYRPWHGSLGTLNRLGEEVKQITRPGEEIIDWVGAAAFLSGTRNIRGFEQGYAVSYLFDLIPDKGINNPPLISRKQLQEMIMNKNVGVIIVNAVSEEGITEPEFRQLIARHYSLYKEFHGNMIYVSPGKLSQLQDQQL